MARAYKDADVQWLQGFKGLNENITPGSRRQVSLGVETVAPVTDDLLNVRVRFGDISGRGGMNLWNFLSASGDNPIIGLTNYRRTDENTNVLVRMTPTTLEKYDASVDGDFVDVTGAALNATSLTRPQFTIQNDILVYTVEGLARPQGYGSNTGVEVNYTTGTELGGTPPYAKCLTSYMQFLLLGNVSNDGTFADVFDGWRLIEYSSSPFTSWTSCKTNVIDLYQTPGSVVAMKPLGRVCLCYKTDGVIRLTWTGGVVAFTQELIPGSVGCVAPLSVADLGNFGHAYLGTNGVIYHASQTAVTPISQEALSRSLTGALDESGFNPGLRYARGIAIPSQDLYVLFYPATPSGQFLDSYVTWNYKSGEFTKGTVGQPIIASTDFQQQNDSKSITMVATNSEVQEFDSTTNPIDDDGVAIDRYWTSGWQKLAGEEGYLFGVVLELDKAYGARIKVSVARDMDNLFQYEQTFDLRSSRRSNTFTECFYKLPTPVFGSWFNVKVKFIHSSVIAATTLKRVGFIGRPEHKYPGATRRVASSQANTENRGF